MYLVFVVFVVVFSQIKVRCPRQRTEISLHLQSVELREQCQGRLPPEVIRRPKRIAFLGTLGDTTASHAIASVSVCAGCARLSAGNRARGGGPTGAPSPQN